MRGEKRKRIIERGDTFDVVHVKKILIYKLIFLLGYYYTVNLYM